MPLCGFSESAICFSRVRPPSEIKSNFKFKTLRWRPLRWRLTLSDLRRNDYQNNSVTIFSCNCPGAITGFSCRAPENNSPKIVPCMGPCPVRAHPVIAPGALTGFYCRAPENNSKIIFPACNHLESEGKVNSRCFSLSFLGRILQEISGPIGENLNGGFYMGA